MGWTMNDLRNEDRAAPIAAPVRGPRTGEVVTGPPTSVGATPLFDGSDRDRAANRRNGARRRVRPADGADRSDTDRDDGAAGRDTDRGDGTRQGEFTFDVTRQVRSMPVAADPDDRSEADHGGADVVPGHIGSGSSRIRGAQSRSGSADELAARVARSRDDGGHPAAGRGPQREATGPTSRPARRRGEVDPGARPDTEPEAGDDADDGDGTDKFPWHHQFGDDDEPRELKANSPLLSRAFRYSVG